MPQIAGKPLYQNLEIYRTIGNNIRKKRKEISYTQQQLAQIIGISHDTLSNIELGKCRTEFAVLKQIAEILHTSCDELASAISQ